MMDTFQMTKALESGKSVFRVCKKDGTFLRYVFGSSREQVALKFRGWKIIPATVYDYIQWIESESVQESISTNNEPIEKEIEFTNKENGKYSKVTITPTRVTIKLTPFDSGLLDESEWDEFANQCASLEVDVSYRGNLAIYPHGIVSTLAGNNRNKVLHIT